MKLQHMRQKDTHRQCLNVPVSTVLFRFLCQRSFIPSSLCLYLLTRTRSVFILRPPLELFVLDTSAPKVTPILS